MDETIYSRFRAVVTKQPERPAILAPGKRHVSFGELLSFIDSSRQTLNTFGVARGTRLGILMNERPQSAIANLVAVSTCTSVPINPEITPRELGERVYNFGIDVLLMSEAIAETLGSITNTLVSTTIVARAFDSNSPLFELTSYSSAREADRSPLTEHDVAFLLQTSGTTGEPKVVPQTQLNRITTSARIGQALRMTSRDRCLNMMPMHHTQGISAELLVPLLNGASVVVSNFDASQLPRAVTEFNPTWFNLVPSMHLAVLDRLGNQAGVFTESSLRLVTTSSAKLSGTIRERLERAYGVPVAEQYGVTECSAVSYSGLPWDKSRNGSVGRPLHDGVKVTDELGDRVSAGETGEICVSGLTVISGYENNPGANAELFRDGWYRTGDEGNFDEDGFLYVTGRIREVVNRGGEKFSLPEIDDALLRLEEVGTGTAFMVPHEKLGHEVYAAVVLVPGSIATSGSLRAHLAKQLSWAKVPKRVFIVDELPMNSTGKVLRQNLAEKLMAEGAG